MMLNTVECNTEYYDTNYVLSAWITKDNREYPTDGLQQYLDYDVLFCFFSDFRFSMALTQF